MNEMRACDVNYIKLKKPMFVYVSLCFVFIEFLNNVQFTFKLNGQCVDFIQIQIEMDCDFGGGMCHYRRIHKKTFNKFYFHRMTNTFLTHIDARAALCKLINRNSLDVICTIQRLVN